MYGRKGKGLNLTREVRDAIVNHTGSTMPKTLEGQVVRRCDRIAYLCHDFDDGCKVGIIGPEKLPGIVAMRLGTEPSQILDVLVHNIVELSLNQPQIIIDKYYEEAVEEFRNFMFDYIYCSPQLNITRQNMLLGLLWIYIWSIRSCCQENMGNWQIVSDCSRL